MLGLQNATQIAKSISQYFENLNQFMEKATKEPELFLKEEFLKYTADRAYFETVFISCFGQEALMDFYHDYFKSMIKYGIDTLLSYTKI